MTRTAILLSVFVLVCTSALAAQQGQHRGQGPMMHGQGRGMGAMAGLQAFSPKHLLHHRDALSLTDDQVKRLTVLRDESTKTYDLAMAGHDRNHQMLMELLGAPEPDPTEARGYFDAAHASMGAAHWARMEARLMATRVLTSAQREMVEGLPAMP